MVLNFNNRSVAQSLSKSQIDQGLRSYMLQVYNYMTTGLAITGAVSYFFAKLCFIFTPDGQVFTTQFGQAIFGSFIQWIIILAPLGFVFYLSSRINKVSVSSALIIFFIFSAAMGLSLSSIFAVYTGASIARVFFISSSVFLAMSLYGYTTKKDLTSFGSFLFMGLIGIIIASLVNIFLKSPMLYFAISCIGVLIFVGLTAYDTQKIKNMYLESDVEEISNKKALMGALSLYLDFINLFIMLLRLFGQRR